MNYKLLVILFIGFLSITCKADPPEERFRVELLVLRHLEGISEADLKSTLRDFSAALDLLPPPVDETMEEQALTSELQDLAEEPEPTVPEESTDEAAPGETVEPLDEAVPGETADPLGEEPEPMAEEPRVVLVEAQSETMQRAWQRLARSRTFRPELYFSWEQAEDEPFPLVRPHDNDLLYQERPPADSGTQAVAAGDARFVDNLEGEGVPTFTDTTTPPAELFGPENGESGESIETVPQPGRYYYRIDGSATLRKTRFLHLDLDIEYREPLLADGERNGSNKSLVPETEQEQPPPAWQVYSLRQSRQVQTQDMEYFDGPVLAVLALISRVETALEPDAAVSRISQ